MKIVDSNGRSPTEHIRQLLGRVVEALRRESGAEMRDSIRDTVRHHFQKRYPGSVHWSPSKVVDGPANGAEGVVNVDVPGASRAYHDIHIRPIHGRKLAIPLHRDALGIGKSPRQDPDLFYAKNKKGTEMLAKTIGGALAVMYILKDDVYQRQDPGLMPSDQTLAYGIKYSLRTLIDRAVKSTQ